MEIHKPKAAHSFREFLTEIGTIICGILIALGLEQAVEAAHRHQEVEEARRALEAEIGYDLTSMDFTMSQMGCANSRLDELVRWRQALDESKPLSFISPVEGPLWLSFHTSVWRVASTGVAAQMPFDARVGYGQLYDRLDNISDLRKQSIELWGELSELSLAASLDRTQRLRVDYDVSRLRRLYPLIATNFKIARRAAKSVGVANAPPLIDPEILSVTRTSATKFCTPILHKMS